MSIVLDKMAKTAHTWNGAISYSTTGTGKYAAILDYWAKAGTYQGRSQEDVNKDMGRIFGDDEKVALAILFGLRLVTRKPNVAGIDEAQTGYGRKDEFFKGFNWLLDNRPKLAMANLHLIPVFGCWKDFLQSPLIEREGKFREAVYDLFQANLGDDMMRKYLPQMYSNNKRKAMTGKGVGKWKVRAHTDDAKKLVTWAQGFARHVFAKGEKVSDEKWKEVCVQYRSLKRDGKGHIWQQQMARQEWDTINFNGIPGKAMLFHTSRKGKKDHLTVFERHEQMERLGCWVLDQPMIKFTGYPYELTRAARQNPSEIQKLIYNRQFKSMLEPMKGHNLGNVLCALDTSGSMGCDVLPKVSALDICLSMGLAFSTLNVGHFQDAVVAFSDNSHLVTLKGEFCDRLASIGMNWMGSTNFQSVIDLLVRIRKKNPEIPVSEFPDTLLVISDMQFNPAGKNTKTNAEVAQKKLSDAGLPDMRFIWWCVNGTSKDFPAQMNDKGMYIISGFDPNNLKALMGLSKEKKDYVAKEKKEETPLDGMMNFLSQPIFGMLQM